MDPDDPIRHSCNSFIMGDDHNGGLILFIDLLQDFKHFPCRNRIQRSCKFVAQKKIGIFDQRSANGASLLLPS